MSLTAKQIKEEARKNITNLYENYEIGVLELSFESVFTMAFDNKEYVKMYLESSIDILYDLSMIASITDAKVLLSIWEDCIDVKDSL